MATKIYVSQIDTANSTGGHAPLGSLILVGSTGPYWSNASITDLLGIHLNEIVGYTGSVGYQGSAGIVGYSGSRGFSGLSGPDGPQGAVGFQGSTGYTGSIGDTGYMGSVGYLGSTGFSGSQGAVGYSGSIGDIGFQGSVGGIGSVGYQGSVGYAGSQGAPGTIGFYQLTDVPQSYSSYAGNFVRVNATANGLVYDSNTYLTNTVSTGINFSGNTIFSPAFQNYSEIINVIGNSTTLASIDLKRGNLATITLTAPIVAIDMVTTGLVAGRSYSITLALKQDASGIRTIDWSSQTIFWPAGEGIYSPAGPALSTQPNYTDFVTLMTFNAGATWFGLMSAKGFPTT
jgi:hypothetical protein